MVDILVISKFQLLQIKLQCMYKPLYGYIILFLLVKYLVVKWLDPIAGVLLTTKETAKMFFRVVQPF